MSVKRRSIVGHPNCEEGECDTTCHNVACAIYQGYEQPQFYEEDNEVNKKSSEQES